jgi:hypothetical protein
MIMVAISPTEKFHGPYCAMSQKLCQHDLGDPIRELRCLQSIECSTLNFAVDWCLDYGLV